MDIKEPVQLDKQGLTAGTAKALFIRTMAKDLEALRKKGVSAVQVETGQKKAVPPAGLPVVESARPSLFALGKQPKVEDRKKIEQAQKKLEKQRKRDRTQLEKQRKEAQGKAQEQAEQRAKQGVKAGKEAEKRAKKEMEERKKAEEEAEKRRKEQEKARQKLLKKERKEMEKARKKAGKQVKKQVKLKEKLAEKARKKQEKKEREADNARQKAEEAKRKAQEEARKKMAKEQKKRLRALKIAALKAELKIRLITLAKFSLVGLVIILIIGSIGGFFYWWNYIREVPVIVTHYQCQDSQCVSVEGDGTHQCLTDEDCQPIEPIEPTIPETLIPVIETQTIDLTIGQEHLLFNKLKSAAIEEQAVNSFRRILVKLVSQTEKKYAGINTLFPALWTNLPDSILQAVAKSNIEAGNYTLFLYNQPEGNRLGLVIDMGQSSSLVQDLKAWESGITTDLKWFLLKEEVPVPATQEFQDNIYQGVGIRYINFPTPDLSIDYALVSGKLVITTSRESMYAAIDALRPLINE